MASRDARRQSVGMFVAAALAVVLMLVFIALGWSTAVTISALFGVGAVVRGVRLRLLGAAGRTKRTSTRR